MARSTRASASRKSSPSRWRRSAARARRRAPRAREASLEAVGLDAADAEKYPHEFSGGQRQRIAIARALITRPKLVVADEPVSALDVSVQAQVLNLMSDLEREAGVTFLLISHDLAVVAHICETTAVMYRGRIVEIGETDALFADPAHPYTRELVDATPRLDRADPVAPLTPIEWRPRSGRGLRLCPALRVRPVALPRGGAGPSRRRVWGPPVACSSRSIRSASRT